MPAAGKIDWDELERRTKPCVGCGHCCMSSPCHLPYQTRPLEALLYHWKGCPDLVFKDGRHWCGVILEADSKDQVRHMAALYVGEGCCSPCNSWRREPIIDRRGDAQVQDDLQGQDGLLDGGVHPGRGPEGPPGRPEDARDASGR